jgi:hypothetical protein
MGTIILQQQQQQQVHDNKSDTIHENPMADMNRQIAH